MDMILGNRAGDDLNVLGLADLSDKVSKALRHLSVEHLLSYFVIQTRWYLRSNTE
jgi:hypothetical protein